MDFLQNKERKCHIVRDIYLISAPISWPTASNPLRVSKVTSVFLYAKKITGG